MGLITMATKDWRQLKALVLDGKAPHKFERVEGEQNNGPNFRQA